jgi:oligosaccharyltransferase complex subunit alpha (ribophorin I)
VISITLSFSTPDDSLEKKNRVVKYGPYKDMLPLAYDFVRLHFQKNEPMPIFTEVSRTVEVSHWGNINVEEHFHLFNEGAGVKGEWGRVDYNSYNPSDGKNAIKNFKVDLPRYIRGLYYYDFIGNISSSNAFRTQEKVEFSIDPRFPIFGQWNTDWNQGYNMPTKYHLFFDSMNPEHYVLNFTFLHEFDDILAENYTLKVVLPEGAENVKVFIPFQVGSIKHELSFSTLDYIGRPTLNIQPPMSFLLSMESTSRSATPSPVLLCSLRPFTLLWLFSCSSSSLFSSPGLTCTSMKKKSRSSEPINIKH